MYAGRRFESIAMRPCRSDSDQVWPQRHNTLRALFQPIFQIFMRESAVVLVRLCECAAVHVGDPSLVRTSAVLGDDEPEETARSMPRNLIAFEQHVTQQGLRPVVTLVR